MILTAMSIVAFAIGFFAMALLVLIEMSTQVAACRAQTPLPLIRLAAAKSRSIKTVS